MRAIFHVAMRLRFWGRVRVHGRAHIPTRGGVLVVSNHVGAGDPEILWAVFPRQLWFMAMDTLFTVPVLGFLVRSAGAFPVRRRFPDRRALRNALMLLACGDAVAIYPEGERSVGADLVPPLGGVGFLALRARVPILPVGMAGSERVFPRITMRPKQPGIDVRIGRPFRLPEAVADRREAADYIMRRVAELLPVQYRGYARDAPAEAAAAP